MITYADAQLQRLSVHLTGNKVLDETYRLSATPIEPSDDILTDLLLKYFLTPFEKVNEVYRLFHTSGNTALNEVFHYASTIFDDATTFHETSILLVKHLFEQANHPRIKSGELYVVLFDGLQIEGEQHQALGLFKSENKEPYLHVKRTGEAFELSYEQAAINIKKLDKGCIIFNTEKEEGFKVAVIDPTNSNTEAAYWIDQFLQLKIRNDQYTQTHTALQVYKQFITQGIDEEFSVSKADKIDLLNRSIQYFKEKDQFNLEEFSNEVIGYEEGIESFKNYKQKYESEYDTVIADQFAINDAAVKKQARVYKSVLKLDRNFHIYIHGSKEMIERGFDEERNLNYYKVFFRDEQ